MTTYYLMTTEQKESVAEELLHQEPFSNIVGDKWILESTASRLNCIDTYKNTEACIEYVQDHVAEWDEFHDI